MNRNGRIGVVTVAYNSEKVIDEFLASLLHQSYSNFKLFVVDNASSDGTLAAIEAHTDPRVVTIKSPINVGVAEGNNIGIRAALKEGCSYILLINNDTAFGPDLLAKLFDGLKKYQCHMIVPKILYSNPSNKIWCAGGTFSRLRGLSRHFGFNQKDDGTFDQPRIVPYSPTCCMLIRKAVFARIGLMDANYFVYFDDTDFCLRAYRAGMKLFYVPSATIYHKVSSLIGFQSDTALRYLSRNHVYYVMKNFVMWTALYYLPICQAQLFYRCLISKNTIRALFIAEKAFWEGIALTFARPQPAKLGSFSSQQASLPVTQGSCSSGICAKQR